MAGGGGKPQNIFRLNRGDDPAEVLNWRLWFAVVSFGIMGAARGLFTLFYTIENSTYVYHMLKITPTQVLMKVLSRAPSRNLRSPNFLAWTS